MKILIADDDHVSRRLLSGTLAQFGHQVVAVEDGHRAAATLLEQDGPGFVNVEIGVAKTWNLGRPVLEFRWEIFNLFNRANFSLPNRIIGTPNFGRMFSTKNPRELQFGARLNF